MGKDKPRISIGLPVYNGERFLNETLNSLLSQTYTNFEIVISDNGSTDQTESICRTHAAQDQRIRYYRNQENLGAAWNFNRVFKLSFGEYFKWHTADDLCVPDHLAYCLNTIEKNPTAVLVYPKTRFINENGEFLDIEDPGWNLQSEKAHERLHYVLFAAHWVNPHYGLIRTSALSRTKLLPDYPSGDYRLLGELSLMGKFIEIHECNFLRRLHPAASNHNMKDSDWMLKFMMGEHERICLPKWEINRDYLLMIMKSELRVSEKMFLISAILRRMHWERNLLMNELASGLEMCRKKIFR
jgi:glycosyltransferase involved in cell wall biosynthesis